jgi:hypothetical protein
MHSLKALVTLTLLAIMASANQDAALHRKDVEARHRDIAMERRAGDPFSFVFNGVASNNGDGSTSGCVSVSLFDA